MPLKLADFARKTRTVTLDFGEDGSLTFTYRPNIFTPRFLTTFEAMAEDEGAMEANAWALTQLLTEWDLIGADGQPVPITQDALFEVHSAIQMRVFEAINAESVPNAESAEPLPTSSRVAAPSAPHRNGSSMSKPARRARR